MKIETQTLTNTAVMQSANDLLFYLEMGNLAGEKGNDQEAIDWYVQGLQQAKNVADKPRIQQFSNLILTYL
ncbi:MAG: hypothetical protein RLZ33_1392 [Bacteroidota bacterium]|jgi:hypothetical protein